MFIHKIICNTFVKNKPRVHRENRLCTGQYIGDISATYWSSTEINNIDGPIGENNKRKAYASNFDFGYDTQSKGNDPNDTIYLFYNSLVELESWYTLAVRAVKKF